MRLSTEQYAALLRNDLYSFSACAFAHLNGGVVFQPNWHIELIAAAIQRALDGGCRRLIVNIPPRNLKSHIASIAAPAFLLGRDPRARILTVSYAQDLAYALAQQSRIVMCSDWYRGTFPTRLWERKNAVGEFHTTLGGYRISTSVGGPLTGRGAHIIIIDDPMKPEDALSASIRTSVNDWFGNTLVSRLDDKNSSIIILIMQRLHEDDLVGHILGRDKWEVINLPAIAAVDERFAIQTPMGPRIFQRKAGEVLHPAREGVETLAQLRRDMGEYTFAAQYLQSPAPLGGGYIKEKWFLTYDPTRPPMFDRIIQSWDTANKASEMADYSVCLTCGIRADKIYILDVFRERLDYPDLKRAVKALDDKYKPKVILIEDKASGTQLAQELKSERMWNVVPYLPKMEKNMRMMAQTPMIEGGRVFMPERASWKESYLHELLMFPKGRHDDQVDATSQLLDYVKDIKPEDGACEFYRRANEALKMGRSDW